MSLKIEFGLSAISSYRRLAYTPYHALAEFIDNSTQSYINHKTELDELYAKEKQNLEVSVTYDRQKGEIRIVDNAYGMSLADLEHALKVATPPANPTGRSKYGLGMKTAACWFGNRWTIRTTKVGEAKEYVATIEVSKVESGDANIDLAVKDAAPDKHYTVIEITNLNRTFFVKALAKIKRHLQSMYRKDFNDLNLDLRFQSEVLGWSGFEGQLLKNKAGKVYRQDYSFEVDGKTVVGWAGILEKGSRSNAGFSILQNKRVIKGWPDSWRPLTIFGDARNDLINQRLCGEINLDGFDVSHTKDDIQWVGEQEEHVEEKLAECLKGLVSTARTFRKGQDLGTGPSDGEIDAAASALNEELQSDEMIDKVEFDDIPDAEMLRLSLDHISEQVKKAHGPSISAQVGRIKVSVYLVHDLSPNDPYVVLDSSDQHEAVVIVNLSHPHVKTQIAGEDGVLNYLRHCVYDALAEAKVRLFTKEINPESVKMIKDQLLRVSFNIDQTSSKEADDPVVSEAAAI